MKLFLILLVALLILVAAGVYLVLKSRNMQIWIPAYLRRQRLKPHDGPRHILFCFVDHYEPMWGGAGYEQECARVKRWMDDYPALADRHQDADGKKPTHCFFYPEEEYREEHLDALTDLCRRGYGEIDVHLHHDNDTSEGLRGKLNSFRKTLHEQHDALPLNDAGEPVYGFIHGNWCLDNARPDGRYCGVNDEIRLLGQNGCYVDFTLPAAPDPSQTRKINAIYYATDDPEKPRSHDTGDDVYVGGAEVGDLMLIQGPLMLNWKDRKLGIIPRIENSDIRGVQPPTPYRTDLWVEANIHVKGRPEWLFIKIHTHGTQEESMDTLLGEPMDRMYTDLETRYNDGTNYVLHYVTAREMYNIVKAAEAGEVGNPNDYRDYIYPRPGFSPDA